MQISVRRHFPHASTIPHTYKGGPPMNVITLLMPKTQVAYLEEDDSIRQGLEKMHAHK